MGFSEFFGVPAPYKEFVEIFFTIILSFLGIGIVKKILDRWLDRLKKRGKKWDFVLLTALKKPLSWFTVFIAGVISLGILLQHYGFEQWVAILQMIRKGGALFFAMWFFLRLIKEGEKIFRQKGKRDETTIKASGQILRITTLVISGLIFMQMLGIPVSGVLAFGGIGGVAVGFAAKDLLANFFGGIIIFLDRPFALGDWIRCPEKNLEGIVEDIGWRLTRIRTLDRRPLYIPNSYFLSSAIENPSRMSHRRIKTTVGVRYTDANKIPTIILQIEEYLKNHPEVDNTTKPCFVSLTNFGASSLDLLIYALIKKIQLIDFEKIQGEIFLKIVQIVDQNGAEIAFPTTTVHVATALDEDKIPFS